MSMNWIKRIGGARLVALALFALLMGGGAPIGSGLTPSAEARIGGRSRGGGFGGGGFGGGFGSFGSRGSRSFNPGQGTTRMQPLPRSQGRDPLAGGANRAGQNRGSWLSRNPLLGTIGAAIAGTVIGSMLMNALGGMGGFGSILMMLLFAGVLFAIFRMIMARKQTAMAGNGVRNPIQNGSNSRQMPYSMPTPTSNSRQEYLDNSARNAPSSYNTDSDTFSDGNTQTREQGLAAIALGDAAMTNENLTDALSSRFFQIQEAWTNGDRQTLTNTLTGELMREFGANLSDMERRGERNILKNIVIRGFEITEAWQEDDREYVTAHISARLLDYTQKGTQIVAGDAQNPTNFSEFWTFVRLRGRGEWILSAINQEA